MSARDRHPPPTARGGVDGPRVGAKTRAPKAGRPPGKFTQHRRLDRLKTALEADPAGLSLAEIATVLHVTPRSVRRYLGYLKLLTPIEAVPASPGRENVWRIKPSERARSVPLRRAPAYCLLAGRAVFEPLKGSALFDALDVVHRQVLQVASRPARGAAQQGEIRGDARLEERLLYLPHPPVNAAGRAEEMDDLFRAVADLHVIEFRYRTPAHAPGESRETQAETIEAHPYAVLLHKGTIHVIALDVARSETRTFAFERTLSLALREGEHFSIPGEIRAADFAHGVFGVAAGEDRTRVLIEFDARVADEIRGRKLHPSQKIGVAADGRVRLSVTLPPSLLPEARRWVLGFADAARVLEPPELVAEVSRALAAASRRYA
jgi:predicted DNA-binding transcriptional regulator YafY